MKPFSFVVTGIGTIKKPIVAPEFLDVIRFTLKVRDPNGLGSNSYIAIGDVNFQEFRFTGTNDSFTYQDLLPNFSLKEIWTIGDNAAADGVLEAFGLQR